MCVTHLVAMQSIAIVLSAHLKFYGVSMKYVVINEKKSLLFIWKQNANYSMIIIINILKVKQFFAIILNEMKIFFLTFNHEMRKILIYRYYCYQLPLFDFWLQWKK